MINNNPLDEGRRARDYAFLLLKFRPRGKKEVELRLKKKGFSPKAITATLSFLEEKGFINDLSFSKGWIESRIRKSLGFRRISQELLRKGVPKDFIEQGIQEASESYSETEMLESLVQDKVKKLQAQGLPIAKIKGRVFGYCARRGFPSESIMEALARFLRDEES